MKHHATAEKIMQEESIKHGIKFPIQLKSYIKLLQLETNSRLGINSSSRNKKKREHLPKITLVDDISSPFWMT